MTGLNDLMDERIKKRQEKCSHFYQDMILGSNEEIFCGKCAKRLKK